MPIDKLVRCFLNPVGLDAALYVATRDLIMQLCGYNAAQYFMDNIQTNKHDRFYLSQGSYQYFARHFYHGENNVAAHS